MAAEFGHISLDLGVASQETIDSAFQPLPIHEFTPQALEIADLMATSRAVVVQVDLDRAKAERLRTKLRYEVQRQIGFFVRFHTKVAPVVDSDSHFIFFSYKDLRDLRSRK